MPFCLHHWGAIHTYTAPDSGRGILTEGSLSAAQELDHGGVSPGPAVLGLPGVSPAGWRGHSTAWEQQGSTTCVSSGSGMVLTGSRAEKLFSSLCHNKVQEVSEIQLRSSIEAHKQVPVACS